MIATNSAFSRGPAARSGRRHVHLRATHAPLGELHEIGDRQPDLGRDLAGVQLAHVRVRMLVDDRHRHLAETSTLLRRLRRLALEHPVEPEAEERQRRADGRREGVRIGLRQLPRVLALRETAPR